MGVSCRLSLAAVAPRRQRPCARLVLHLVIVLFVFISTLSSSACAQSNPLQIARCRFSMENDMTSTSINMNPTALSNVLQVTLSNVLSGAVTAKMICMDSSSTILFSKSFQFEGGSLTRQVTLGNLEPSSSDSTFLPVLATMTLQDSASETRASASARSSNGSSFAYTFSATSENGSVISTSSCALSSSACNVVVDVDTADTVVLAAEQNGQVAKASVDLNAVTTGLYYSAFNQQPRITWLEASADTVQFESSLSLQASFLDFDVSNASANNQVLRYAFAIDHVDATGNVITAGGGSFCLLSWLSLSASLPLSGAVASLGPVERTLQGSFTPTGTGVDRHCMIRFTVTDWQEFSDTQTILVAVSSSAPVTTSPVSQATSTAHVLPFVFARDALSSAQVTVILPDKCDGIVCAAETQCLQASVCDSSTGNCLPQVVKANVPCDDGDDTTRDDTCSLQGVCVGTSKCLGVECYPLSTCHNAGSCIPNQGICSPSTLKQAGDYCNDEDDTTVFDICDAVGNCRGTDVAHLIRDDDIDFTNVAGVDPIRLRTFLASLPDVCCETEVCCRPCTSGACSSTVYDQLWYLQTDL
eukprot:m.130020 g.130020  ORF g.130020 m.130020 type:complete len:587 (+) comp15711_c4_seq1:254-2014(+)